MGKKTATAWLLASALGAGLLGCGSSSDSGRSPGDPDPTSPVLLEPGDVQVQVAYDEGRVAFRFSWKSHPKTRPAGFANTGRVYPGQFHDVMQHDGTAFARLPEGTRMDEDRVTFMLEDPSRPVEGFGAAGCYVSCHADMKDGTRDHHLAAAGFLDHWHWRGGRSGPMGYAEDGWVSSNTRERDAAGTPPSAWLRAAGDRLREDQGALANTGHALADGLPRFVFHKGKELPGGFVVPSYFLTLEDGAVVTDPHAQLPLVADVGANRSLLVVYQDRGFDPVDKVNAVDVGYLVYAAGGTADHLPAHLRPGNAAFSQERFDLWAAFWAEELGVAAGASSAAEERLASIHAEWEDSGRLAQVTRSVGFVYASDQHDIASVRAFDPELGVWTVTLVRALTTGRTNDTDLAALKTGGQFHLGFALHDVGGGSETHHVSLPLTLGATEGADLVASSVPDAVAVDWASVPGLVTRVYQPGLAVTYDELRDPALHPGAGLVGTWRCQECHTPDDLADLIQE